MSLFPMFLKLTGRACLVVGAGSVGEAKIRTLLSTGALLRVVAPRATPGVREWVESGRIAWEARGFVPADLEGMFLVIAATSSVEVNDRVFREAQQRGVLCNVVDDPARCDFYYPALFNVGACRLQSLPRGKVRLSPSGCDVNWRISSDLIMPAGSSISARKGNSFWPRRWITNIDGLCCTSRQGRLRSNVLCAA